MWVSEQTGHGAVHTTEGEIIMPRNNGYNSAVSHSLDFPTSSTALAGSSHGLSHGIVSLTSPFHRPKPYQAYCVWSASGQKQDLHTWGLYVWLLSLWCLFSSCGKDKPDEESSTSQSPFHLSPFPSNMSKTEFCLLV